MESTGSVQDEVTIMWIRLFLFVQWVAMGSKPDDVIDNKRGIRFSVTRLCMCARFMADMIG